MKIVKATMADVDEVVDSYEELFDYFATHKDPTLWKRGTYPNRDVAAEGASHGWLYVLRDDAGALIGSAIFNHVQGNSYGEQPWRYPAEGDEVFVLHTLCIRPSQKSHGAGHAMVQFFMDLAREKGCKVCRLDTNLDNIPASHLYENMGFQLVSTGNVLLKGRKPGVLRYYEQKLTEKPVGKRTITQATAADIDDIARSYEELFDYFETHKDTTLWQRGMYPTRQVAAEAVAHGFMYVMRDEKGMLLASVQFNHDQAPTYKDQPWRYPAEGGEVLVGHTLCVRPCCKGCGAGHDMVAFGMELGRKQGCKVMRFDTHRENVPAAHMYEDLGFQLVSTGNAILNGVIPRILRYYEQKL